MEDQELIALLKKFCASPKESFYARYVQPFSIGVFTYATNGRVMVRVDRAIYGQPTTMEDPCGETKWWTHKEPYHTWAPLPTFTIDDLTMPCRACKGLGTTSDCEECNGSGEVEWDTEWHSYSATCKMCRGDGTVASQKNEEPKETCVRCGGLGKEPDCVQFGEHSERGINSLYLSLLAELPGIEISPHQDNENGHFSFRWAGGEGIVMPMVK